MLFSQANFEVTPAMHSFQAGQLNQANVVTWLAEPVGSGDGAMTLFQVPVEFDATIPRSCDPVFTSPTAEHAPVGSQAALCRVSAALAATPAGDATRPAVHVPACSVYTAAPAALPDRAPVAVQDPNGLQITDPNDAITAPAGSLT